nr:plasmid recombination protein [Enterovibrio norvegicus]PMI30896.1 hypothetical protein BCU47_16820 [Enterovibrio norvegicus]
MYQFLHEETYARTSRTRKNGDQKRSIARIALEVDRVKGNTSHIKRPKEPTLIFGVNFRSAAKIAQSRAEQGRDNLGRKIRSDAQIAIGGVISFPPTFKKVPDKLDAIVSDCVQYLEKRFTTNLLSIVLHMDEKSPHLHYFVTPPEPTIENNFRFHISDIYQPIKRRDSPSRSTLKEKSDAFKEACRKIQDTFYEEVSRYHGLGRFGPRRMRLPAAAYKVLQHFKSLIEKGFRDIKLWNKALKIKEEKQNRTHQELKNKRQELLERENKLLDREKILFENVKVTKTNHNNLLNFNSKLKEKESSINEREKSATIRELKLKQREYEATIEITEAEHVKKTANRKIEEAITATEKANREYVKHRQYIQATSEIMMEYEEKRDIILQATKEGQGSRLKLTKLYEATLSKYHQAKDNIRSLLENIGLLQKRVDELEKENGQLSMRVHMLENGYTSNSMQEREKTNG